MNITIKEPYNTWLAKQVPATTDENTLFSIKVAVAGPDGLVDENVQLDLTWFVLLYLDGSEEVKINTALELLQRPDLLFRFKASIDNPSLKRMLAEFLLFHFSYLDRLKFFIAFDKLNVPIDFISHALFIKRGEKVDTRDISAERLKIVSAVLDSGYKLSATNQANAQGAVLRKVLLMDLDNYKFAVAKRLYEAGYRLFNFNLGNNADEAVALIDARTNADSQFIIQANLSKFKDVQTIITKGATNNLADFYFWVREDMDAVKYVKDVLGIELSPTT